MSEQTIDTEVPKVDLTLDTQPFDFNIRTIDSLSDEQSKLIDLKLHDIYHTNHELIDNYVAKLLSFTHDIIVKTVKTDNLDYIQLYYECMADIDNYFYMIQDKVITEIHRSDSFLLFMIKSAFYDSTSQFIKDLESRVIIVDN